LDNLLGQDGRSKSETFKENSVKNKFLNLLSCPKFRRKEGAEYILNKGRNTYLHASLSENPWRQLC